MFNSWATLFEKSIVEVRAKISAKNLSLVDVDQYVASSFAEEYIKVDIIDSMASTDAHFLLGTLIICNVNRKSVL